MGPQKTPAAQDRASQDAWGDRGTQARVPATRTERDKGGSGGGPQGRPAGLARPEGSWAARHGAQTRARERGEGRRRQTRVVTFSPDRRN